MGLGGVLPLRRRLAVICGEKPPESAVTRGSLQHPLPAARNSPTAPISFTAPQRLQQPTRGLHPPQREGLQTCPPTAETRSGSSENLDFALTDRGRREPSPHAAQQRRRRPACCRRAAPSPGRARRLLPGPPGGVLPRSGGFHPLRGRIFPAQAHPSPPTTGARCAEGRRTRMWDCGSASAHAPARPRTRNGGGGAAGKKKKKKAAPRKIRAHKMAAGGGRAPRYPAGARPVNGAATARPERGSGCRWFPPRRASGRGALSAPLPPPFTRPAAAPTRFYRKNAPNLGGGWGWGALKARPGERNGRNRVKRYKTAPGAAGRGG